MKVFLFGSRNIRYIPPNTHYLLKTFIKAGDSFIIGDCYGADLLFQKLLKYNNCTNTTVYHIGNKPRNNIGFNTKQISGSNFSDKDDAMIRDCDCAIAVHINSPGSLRNIKILKSIGKSIWEFGPDEIQKLNHYYNNFKRKA